MTKAEESLASVPIGLEWHTSYSEQTWVTKWWPLAFKYHVHWKHIWLLWLIYSAALFYEPIYGICHRDILYSMDLSKILSTYSMLSLYFYSSYFLSYCLLMKVKKNNYLIKFVQTSSIQKQAFHQSFMLISCCIWLGLKWHVSQAVEALTLLVIESHLKTLWELPVLSHEKIIVIRAEISG